MICLAASCIIISEHYIMGIALFSVIAHCCSLVTCSTARLWLDPDCITLAGHTKSVLCAIATKSGLLATGLFHHRYVLPQPPLANLSCPTLSVSPVNCMGPRPLSRLVHILSVVYPAHTQARPTWPSACGTARVARCTRWPDTRTPCARSFRWMRGSCCRPPTTGT